MKKIRNMIVGTDWWDDRDDAAALRILVWAHRRGDIRLLGIAINACSPLSGPSLDAFLAREGLVMLPIGLDRRATDFGGQLTYQARLARLPGQHRANEDCEDGVALYRRLLASAEEPVDLVEIGFSSILSALLESKPDGYTALDGCQLVKQKVRKLWMMAGKWDEEGGRENNFARNARARQAAALVCRQWPTEITFLGFEVGCTVITGAGLPEQDVLGRIFRDHGSPRGRYSWDPMLAYMACLQDETAAGYRRMPGWASVDEKSGCNRFRSDPEGRHGFVVKTQPDEAYAYAIDKILMDASRHALDRKGDR